MGMGLDHCIHCAFHVLCFNMLHDCVLCVVCIIYMIKCIWKKRNTRVRKHNLKGSGKRMNGIVRDVKVY